MIVFDLFENEQPARDPVEDPRTATDQATKAQSLFIYQELVKAYKSGAPISTIEWTTPGVPAMTMSRNQIYTVLWNYAMAMKKGPKKKEEFARMFANRSDLFNYVGSLKKILKAPPAADIPTPTVGMPGDQGPVQATQGRLFKEAEKKSSEDPKFKSTRLDRLKTQARARHPAAASDMEAMVADFVDQQTQDQAEFDRVKNVNRRQDELLKKITDLNQAQDQEIDNLESEEAQLQQNIKQIQAANAALAQKLAAMSQRRAKVEPEPTPQIGVSVATDKIATLPATGATPAVPSGVSTTQPQQPPALSKPKRRRIAKPLDTAQSAAVGGTSAEVLPKKQVRRKKGEQAPLDLHLPTANGSSKATTATDVEFNEVPGVSDNYDNLMSVLRGQKVEIEEDTIPLKSVVQGYQVDYDPRTRRVTVSRRGQVIGSGINRLNSAKYHLTLINKIIDRAEDDKYPTDIDDRDVALPMRTTEGSVYGQQGFDIQLELARLRDELARAKPAQSAPQPTSSVAPQPVAYRTPATLSDMQARQQRLEALVDVKGKIEKLQHNYTKSGRMLPRGLAADLEDYYTLDDVDQHFDAMLAKYQAQHAALDKFVNLQKILKKKATHEMRANELQEGGPETWTVYFTDGTTTRVRVPNDETDPARVRAFFAKKGKTVSKFDYGFGTSSDPVSKPEPHEPGSGTAVSARTGEKLPEDAVDRSGSPMYKKQEAYMIVHNGRDIAFYKPSDMKQAYADAEELAKKHGGEVHVKKVMREGRAGYNPMNTEKDWHEVEQYLSNMINDRTLDPETRAEYRQRYLEKRREAQQKGWAK